MAALLFDLVPLTALQCAFAVVCLPVGEAASKTKAGKQSESKRNAVVRTGSDSSTGAKIKVCAYRGISVTFIADPVAQLTRHLFLLFC